MESTTRPSKTDTQGASSSNSGNSGASATTLYSRPISCAVLSNSGLEGERQQQQHRLPPTVCSTEVGRRTLMTRSNHKFHPGVLQAVPSVLNPPTTGLSTAGVAVGTGVATGRPRVLDKSLAAERHKGNASSMSSEILTGAFPTLATGTEQNGCYQDGDRHKRAGFGHPRVQQEWRGGGACVACDKSPVRAVALEATSMVGSLAGIGKSSKRDQIEYAVLSPSKPTRVCASSFITPACRTSSSTGLKAVDTPSPPGLLLVK